MVAPVGRPLRPRPGRSREMLRKGGIEVAAKALNDRVQASENNTLFDRAGRSDPGFAPLPGGSAWSEPDQRWLGSRTTRLARWSPAQIDDPVRRCQFSPPAPMAALLDLESAGRIGALPDNRVALLTNEAH